jgi:hypothetical protein
MAIYPEKACTCRLNGNDITASEGAMVNFEDLVRNEAYLIWESEGRPQGKDGHHWQIALSRVQNRLQQIEERTNTPVVPLSVKRVALLARNRPQTQTPSRLRASA